MRDITLEHTTKNNVQQVEILFDGKSLKGSASNEMITDCDDMHKVSVMKEIIKALAGEFKSQIKDITEAEQTKLDSLVVDWIRKNAPEKDMTIIRGKKK